MYIPLSFLSNASTESLAIDYLLVGGGGAGGDFYHAGGGGGGYISGSLTLRTFGTFPIEVGAGGFYNVMTQPTGALGKGRQTVAFGMSACGGGYPEGVDRILMNGGSGCGGPFIPTGSSLDNSPGLAICGTQGNNGGPAQKNTDGAGQASGGGGGAGTSGSAPTSASLGYQNGGNGGNGKLWLDNIYYAGGGGGYSSNASGGNGGLGGGANAGAPYPVGGNTNGVNGLGGGGGGLKWPFSNDYRGGSGVVKFRYPGGYKPNVVGGTVTQSGSFTYHSFTASANLTYSPSQQTSSSLDMFPSGAYVIYDFGNRASYPGTGTTVYDLVGNSVGTFTGTFETGSGGILRLNSASNQRVAYSGSVTPNVTIVSIWKNVNISFPESALCDASFNYGIKTSTLGATNDYVPILYTTTSNTYSGATNTLSDVQVFHQYATAVSASVGGNSTATTYIDGSGSAASESKSFNRNQNGNGVIFLGFDRAVATRYSNGWLMAHLHYNRTLSEAELQQIYSVFSTRF